MKIINCEQGSLEWFEARLCIPSSSNFDKIITTAGKPSKQREKYMYRLAGEAVSGVLEESYQNAAMLRGIEMEDEAKQLYTLITGNEVTEVGFCVEEGYGASPDGLIAEKGCLELKCPLVATHVGYLLANKLPTDYFQQVQGQLLVTGREWADFMSYSPGLKPMIVRVNRDETFINALKIELAVFCEELRVVIGKIK